VPQALPVSPLHALSLRAYAQYVRCAFQRRAAYRLANLTGVLVNFFFFLIHAQVFLAFFGTRSAVAGWSPSDAVLYFATSESLLMTLGLPGVGEVLSEAGRIRTGDFVVDLTRPVWPWRRTLAESFGQALYYLGTRTVVLYLASTALYGIAPPLVARLLLVPAAIALAVAISALLLYLACATAYWTEYASGAIRCIPFAGFLFGGVVVPLDFYPEGFRGVCDVLPFRAIIYTPIALATGKLEGAALGFALGHQVVWCAILAGLAQAVDLRGLRRLVALGG